MPQPVSTTFKVSMTDEVVEETMVAEEAAVAEAKEVAVSAKLDAPAARRPGSPFLVLAHGANNDLDFPLLAYIAGRLAELAGVSTVRFNFPYVERGVSSPDPRPVLEHTLARVYAHVVSELAEPGAPIFIGGKSLGGRAACELVSRQAEGSGLATAGLIVLGYPLHRPGHKEQLFLSPLRHVDVPSLFCIGTRDTLCDAKLLAPVLEGLMTPGTLYVVEGGDHSLHLPHSGGRQPSDSYEPVTQQINEFIRRALGTT